MGFETIEIFIYIMKFFNMTWSGKLKSSLCMGFETIEIFGATEETPN